MEKSSSSRPSSESSSTNSVVSWIAWHCALPPNQYYIQVPEAWIEDDFNMTGLSSQVMLYANALDMILDLEEDEPKVVQPEETKLIEESASILYSLIHARFILTKPALHCYKERLKEGEFGICPRAGCQGASVLPCGISDDAGVSSMKVYCNRCSDIYNPKQTKFAVTDGCSFGTTFHTLFFSTYPMTQDERLEDYDVYVPKIFGFKLVKPFVATLHFGRLKEMSEKLEVYSKGTKAWFKDAEEGYLVGTLLSQHVDTTNVTMTFQLDVSHVEVKYQSTLAKLEQNNYEDLPSLQNPPRLEGADDLTTLSYLHEAAVLHSVKIRYIQEIIYTYSGLVLIAMNPFRRLNIYTPEIMRQYAGRPRHELEPHLFAIAEEAYRKMINEDKNQSIIVSGESGAGKTQSAKFVMRYFAVVADLAGSRRSSLVDGVVLNNGSSSIEDAVLSTNPIMEAFGNAKTTRNDNSSRFGKYIEILFKRNGGGIGVTITGARMRTYLLERSRLVFQPESERNYHIFYQLCAAVPAAEKAELGLEGWDSFHYLRQGKTGTVKGMDDVEEFGITQKGMSTVGISVSCQWDIFKICAALLHIGNIMISEVNGMSYIEENDDGLVLSAKLLGLDCGEFRKWLMKRQITTRNEKFILDSSLVQATNSRDSIAKFVYAMLFDWIVNVVNKKLDTSSSREELKFIGVLDIYGFEHFKKNSFEQFCINYANEKLQQEFTRHVFRLEQEEYVQEEIQWSFIDFSDNQLCIDMIENKMGILDLLDEESRLPAGSDTSLVNKLYNHFGTAEFKFFDKPRFGETEFVIKHYALDVSYLIEGFIEKNKDTVSEEQLGLMGQTTFDFFKEVITPVVVVKEIERASVVGRGRAGGVKKATLGSIFKASLVQLMDTLRSTNPHYIRCIKPNQSKKAFEFEPQNVLSQLIACGVLETIKISRAGYPSKQTYEEFNSRYYFLAPSSQWRISARDLCSLIVSSVIKGVNKYEMGHTKVFFRAGQLAYLEKQRSEKFLKVVILIQKNMKRGYFSRIFKEKKVAVLVIQTAFRGYLGRNFVYKLRRAAACLRIQTFVRSRKALQAYQRTRRASVFIQRMYKRKLRARERLLVGTLGACLIVQKWFRMILVRRKYLYRIRQVTLIQSLYRRRVALQGYKLRKMEASSVGKLQETNFTLEKKLIEVSLGLDAKRKEFVELSRVCVGLESSVVGLKERLIKVDSVNRSKGVDSLEQQLDLKRRIHSLEETNVSQAKEIEQLKGMIRKRDDHVSTLIKEIDNQSEEGKKENKKDLKELVGLKKEVSLLKSMNDKLVEVKYRTDISTSRFYDVKEYFDSAIQATQRVMHSRSNTVTSNITVNKKRLVEDDDSKPTDRFSRMLNAADLLEEVQQSLITHLKVPLNASSKKDILYPSHLIGFLIHKLIQHKMLLRLKEVVSTVIDSFMSMTLLSDADYSFWISNLSELYSILHTCRLQAPNPTSSSQSDESSLSATLSDLCDSILNLSNLFYQNWILEVKKSTSLLIIPAVVEDQMLPGYKTSENGGLWSQWSPLSKPSKPYSIELFLILLSKMHSTMTLYYLDQTIIRQVFSEIYRYIGITSFNHLLMRKNFCTWKRGVQIQHNVSRLEEWAHTHKQSDCVHELRQLSQTAKLLTLNKNTSILVEIESIFDVCFLLNASQIKKLLSLYYAADSDSPLSVELVAVVTQRALGNEDNLLIEVEECCKLQIDDKIVKLLERFVPLGIELPYVNLN